MLSPKRSAEVVQLSLADGEHPADLSVALTVASMRIGLQFGSRSSSMFLPTRPPLGNITKSLDRETWNDKSETKVEGQFSLATLVQMFHRPARGYSAAKQIEGKRETEP